MSINPVLAQDATAKNELFPLPKPYEMFILKRDGISFQASNSERKLRGDGKLFLTNQRLVFLKNGKPEKHKVFTSIELPLDTLSGKNRAEPPEFHQPVFGANYLEGHVEPTPNATNPLNSATSWILYFNKGGCAMFLRAFYRLRQQAIQAGRSTGPSPFTTPVEMSQQAAFYDPSDPSILYLTQPVPTQPVPTQQAPPQNAPFPLPPPIQYNFPPQQGSYPPPPHAQQGYPQQNPYPSLPPPNYSGMNPPPQGYAAPPGYSLAPQYMPPPRP